MGGWVVITGASSGIGLEIARLFAADGWSIAAVARDAPRLQSLAAELQAKHKVDVRVLPFDLSAPEAARKVFEACGDLEVRALVNNAGFGIYGPFADNPFPEAAGMVQVNIVALMHLTHLFLPQMRSRGKGVILNVGSVAAFQPGPTMAVYYASKAFVYSFSYALAAELRDTGVTVTLLNPGTTRTDFFDRAGIHMSRPFPLMDAARVARIGYRAAMEGKRSVTAGWMNRLLAIVSPALPSGLTAGIVERVHRRR